ncbi:MAG: ankyrin repeat domain-containing protein [Armatimonadota bacterium]
MAPATFQTVLDTYRIRTSPQTCLTVNREQETHPFPPNHQHQVVPFHEEKVTNMQPPVYPHVITPSPRQGLPGWAIALLSCGVLLLLGVLIMIVMGVFFYRAARQPVRSGDFASAVTNGCIDTVKRQLDVSPALVNRNDGNDLFPIIMASRDPEMVKLLIARGADPNIQGKYNTPLTMIALNAKPEEVELLIAVGAKVNLKDMSGQTPLHAAASMGNKPVVAVLIAHGAEVNALNKKGYTPFREAQSQEKQFNDQQDRYEKTYRMKKQKVPDQMTKFRLETKQKYQETKKHLRQHGGKE